MHDTRGWKGKRLRYGAAIIGAFALIVSGGVRPLGGQTLGLISGHVRVETDQPDTRLSVQARDIKTGEVVATSEVDEKTAEYELASLPEGSFLVELVDRGGDVFCTEGPFEIAGDRLLYESQNIACSDSGPRWWVPFLAAAAAGTTTGVIAGGSSPSPTICHEGGTVVVEKNPLPGHLSHGDFLGACPASPSR